MTLDTLMETFQALLPTYYKRRDIEDITVIAKAIIGVVVVENTVLTAKIDELEQRIEYLEGSC